MFSSRKLYIVQSLLIIEGFTTVIIGNFENKSSQFEFKRCQKRESERNREQEREKEREIKRKREGKKKREKAKERERETERKRMRTRERERERVRAYKFKITANTQRNVYNNYAGIDVIKAQTNAFESITGEYMI